MNSAAANSQTVLLTARTVEGSRILPHLMVYGAKRWADDGFKCPGHPDWFPTEPRRQLRSERCSIDLGLIAVGGRLYDVNYRCSAG